MYKIIEYKDNYKEKVIDFWLEIYVYEYRIKEWTVGIKDTFTENSFWNLFIVLDINDNIIGTIGVKKHNDKAEIKRLCIKKEFRGQGLAREMMEHAIQQIKKEGIRKVCLYTVEALKSAIIFYEKNGFKKIETSDKEAIGYEKNISEEC